MREEADIQLRVLPTLLPFWDQVITSTLGFSGIRAAERAGPSHSDSSTLIRRVLSC